MEIRQPSKLTTFGHENNIYLRYSTSLKQITVTSNDKHISVYDVSERRCIGNWSIKSGQQLTCSAIQAPDASHAVVLNGKTIRTWTKDDTQIDKGKKIQVGQTVWRLYQCGDWVPLVVYESGTVSWLSGVADAPQGEPLSEQVSWCEVAELAGRLYLVLMAESGQARVYCWSQQGAHPTTHTLTLNTGDTISYCLHHQQEKLHIITLESTGQLHRTTVSGDSVGDTVKLQKIPHLLHKPDVCSLGPSCLAIAGISQVQQGGSTSEYGLGIWDLKFGILQAWTQLTEAYNTQLQLCNVGGTVCVVCGKSLYVYPITTKTPTLSAALGKFTSGTKTQVSTKSNIQSLLQELADPKKTHSHTHFKRLFSQLMKVMSEQREEVLLCQDLLATVLRRCLHEKQFWAMEQLRYMITHTLVPYSVYTDVFGTLASRGDLVLLYACLTHLHDIPESDMVTTLQCFLRTDDNKFAGVLDEEMADTTETPGDKVSSPLSTHKAAFVNKVLQLPYSDIFMVENLKTLEFTEVKDLLAHLYSLLASVAYTDDTHKTQGSLSMTRVVEWISLVLDAHFTQMILSTDTREILLNLHQLVESQVQLSKELVSLDGILTQLKEKSGLPPKQPPGPYSISVLHVY